MLGTVGDGNSLSIVGGGATRGLTIGASHIVDVLQSRHGSAVDGQSIALSGQVHGVLLVEVDVLAVLDAGHLSGIDVLGAVDGDVTSGHVVGSILSNLAGSGGSTSDGIGNIAVQDGGVVLVGDSHGQNGILLIGIRIEAVQDLIVIIMVIIVGADVGAVDVLQLNADRSALVLQRRGQIIVNVVDLGIGVRTDDDGSNIVVVVLISLNDVALTGQGLHIIQVSVLAHQLAVAIHVSGVLDVLSGVVQVIAVGDQHGQILLGILNHIGGIGVVSIGADGVAIILPSGGGTAEVIGVSHALQLIEVLLGKLHLAVVLDIAVGLGGVGQLVSAVVANSDGAAVVGVDSDLGVIVDHGGLHGVEGIQASLFTGDSVHANEVVVAVIQADADGALANGDGPVGTGVALDGAVIAQGTQQHLHEGIAGQRSAGLEGAVGITGDDALLLAVSNVAREVVGGRNVAVGSGVSAQSAGGGGPEDQVADDLSSRATGQSVLGVEGAVFVAVNDPHGGHHVNSFFVLNLAVVREVLGTGRDSDQRHGHRQSQNQRKELLHGIFSSF